MRIHLKRPLTDKGYVWESRLLAAGFEKLAKEQQYGVLVEDGLFPLLVRWNGVDLETVVFPNEVLIE